MLDIRNRTFKVKYFGKNIIYPQKGEIYDAVGIDDGFYIIINDVNRRVLYFMSRFIPLKKDRNNKISKLIDLL